MDKSDKKYEILGDSPVLDILHISFQDLEYGRMTPRGRLYRLMLKAYPDEDSQEIKNIISNVIDDNTPKNAFNDNAWFKNAGQNIHLTERGVEVYVNMIQHYSAEKDAERVNNKTRIITYISLVTLIVTIALFLIEQFLLKK